MSTDGAIRASDADREHALSILRDAYAVGRLTLAEFHERTSGALTGRTWGDLWELTRDLPAGTDRWPVKRASPQPAAPSPRPPPPAALTRGSRPLVPMLPIGLVWLVVVLAAHAPGVLIPVVFLVLLALVHGGGRLRRDPGGRCAGRRGPSGRAGGQA